MTPTTDSKGERPMRRDAARNRERLLDAAAEVFAESGLQGTVEDVARVAGVGMGTLYRRFPTKEALIDALVSAILDDILRDARVARDAADGQGLRDFLVAVGERQAHRHGQLPRIWGAERHAEPTRKIQAEIAALLADAQEHGRVRADAVPADIFAAIWSLRGVTESTRGVAPDAWRRHLEILLAGLEPSHAPLTYEPLARDVVERLPAR
ncbi:MAG: TetR/AcrR family transcriptional regulator [Patulibacter sp.]|nr:TetR/AcrR family transcriptional regulator [Patulibacter sp.]